MKGIIFTFLIHFLVSRTGLGVLKWLQLHSTLKKGRKKSIYIYDECKCWISWCCNASVEKA
jgi:hypothetical protein